MIIEKVIIIKNRSKLFHAIVSLSICLICLIVFFWLFKVYDDISNRSNDFLKIVLGIICAVSIIDLFTIIKSSHSYSYRLLVDKKLKSINSKLLLSLNENQQHLHLFLFRSQGYKEVYDSLYIFLAFPMF